MTTGFSYWYVTFKCKFCDLSAHLAKSSDETRKDAEERYREPMVEVDTFRKVGFRKYVVIFKVTGEVIPHEL